MWFWLIVVGTSIWAGIDSARLGARRGLVPGFWNLGPAGWFFGCLLLWIVGFPGYLFNRGRIKEAAERAASGSGYSFYDPAAPNGVGQQAWNPGWQPQWHPPPQAQQHPPLSTAGWTAPGYPTPAMQPAPQPRSTPNAGWYLDGNNDALLRWWDGEGWTEMRKPLDR